MTTGWIALVGIIGAAVGGAVSALITALRQRGADRSADWAAFSEALQDRVAAQDAKIAAQDVRIAEQDAKIAELTSARVVAEQRHAAEIATALVHIALLEQGALAGTVPPIPPRPTVLGGP